MKKTALIMAGGRGERFWPKSRKSHPKQFLCLTEDGKTMIQHTVERILPMVEPEDIYIAANRDYKELVQGQLPQIPEENILCEPVGRNTAPCIGWAAAHIRRRYGDAVMIVLPSDHLIKYNAIFLATLREGCQVAEEGRNLVTIGITPSHPETGYGYVQFDSIRMKGKAFAVDRFVEKPDRATAKAYLESEQYLWNSGIFLWKASAILENIRAYLPHIYEGLEKVEAAMGTAEEEKVLEREFFRMPSTSIDYGVMEKAKDIYILPGAFGWDDVGSWLALDRINPQDEMGNVISGNVITVETHNSIIQGGEKLMALVGVRGMIAVDTGDALLLCDKDSTGEMKRAMVCLRAQGRAQYI